MRASVCVCVLCVRVCECVHMIIARGPCCAVSPLFPQNAAPLCLLSLLPIARARPLPFPFLSFSLSLRLLRSSSFPPSLIAYTYAHTLALALNYEVSSVIMVIRSNYHRSPCTLNAVAVANAATIVIVSIYNSSRSMPRAITKPCFYA